MIQHYQRRLPESIGFIVQTKWEYTSYHYNSYEQTFEK